MKRISFVMTLLVAMLLLASCSKNQSASLIPEDALMVMRFDVTKMQEQSGMNDGKSELKKRIREFIKDADMDKELRNRLLEIVDDPTASGIDFTEPIYFYFAGDMERKVDLGFVATMADQGSFKDLLKAILEEDGDLELEEAEGGVQYVNMHGTALIFSSDWVYAGQASDIEETVAELQERASSSKNFANTPAFAKLEKKDGLAQMLFLGAGIEAMNTREVKEAKKAINKMLPDGAELKDVASLTDFTLGDGELLISAETVPLSDAWQEYIDKTDKTALDFTKEQCKYVSGEALSVFANFDIKTYYKLLKPVLKEQMGAGSDELEIIDQLVKSLDGTVAFDLYGLNDESEPQFSLYVGTKNDEPINFVLENMADSVVNNGDGEYLIPINEYDWFSETYEFKGFQGVGYRNGMTYYVTDPETAFSAAGEKFPTKELKGKGFYARFNFGFLNKLASEMRGEEADIAEKVADTYDTAEMYYEGNGKAVLRITTKSKKTNPIQALIKLAEDYL